MFSVAPTRADSPATDVPYTSICSERLLHPDLHTFPPLYPASQHPGHRALIRALACNWLRATAHSCVCCILICSLPAAGESVLLLHFLTQDLSQCANRLTLSSRGSCGLAQTKV